MKHGILSFLMCTLCTPWAKAQTTEPMVTDRPDQTESPFLVPIAHVQIEAGVAQFTTKNSVADQYTSSLPAVLGRIGLMEFAELRIGGNNDLLHAEGQDISNGYWERSVFAGLKMPIYKGKGDVTRISFIGHIKLESPQETFFDDAGSITLMPDFRFTVQHSFLPWYALSYNVGCVWETYADQPHYLYTLSHGFSVTDHIGAFVEIFGQFSRENYAEEHMIDGGFTWMLFDKMQFDASGGIGINEYAPDYFLSFGYSLRLAL